MKLTAWIALSFALASQAFAVVLPYTFTTTLPPSQINANFSALRDATNAHEALRNGHNTRLRDVLSVDNSVSSYSIDFNSSQLLSARVENLSADPTCGSSTKGRLILNTNDGLLKFCDGSTYVSIAGTGVNTLASVLTAGNTASDDIDMDDNELLNVRVENVVSEPSAGNAGRLVFDTSDSTLKVDTGSAIQAIGGAQGLSSVLGVSNSAGSTNIDFNGNEAVKLRGEQLSSDPGTSYAGRLYYNTTGNKFRFYNGSDWADVGNTNTLSDVLALGNSAGSSDLNLNSNELLNAIIQNNSGDPSTGVPGQIWFETGVDSLKFGTSGANRQVATLDGTETLTNKTISGSSNTITNIPDSALSSNIPKKDSSATISGAYTFSTAPTVSAIKTPSGATHTVTDGLSDDTVVLANAAQELKGKTLQAPTLSGNLDFNDYQGVDMRLENRTSDPSSATGKVYYNTATGEVRFYSGSGWRVLTSNVAGGSAWGTSGNAGLSTSNFIGNTDAVDLIFKTNSAERLRITSTGSLDTTLGAGVVQSDASGILSSSDLDSGSIDFTPGVASDWTSSPATVQDALDELGGRESGGVTDVSVASANGFAGTVADSTSTPAITLSTTVSGLLKGDGTAISAATAGTDYAPATSGASTELLANDGSGGFQNVTVGTGLDLTAGVLTVTGGGGVGDVSSNTSSSVDGEIALFSGTDGKTIKRATGSGLAKLTSGVLGTATSGTDYAPATSGTSILYGDGSGGFSAVTVGSGLDFTGGTLSATATPATAITKDYNISSHGFSVGDILNCTSTTSCTKSKADSEANSEISGMVSSVADTDHFTLTQIGYVTGLPTMTANEVEFLSDVTAGAMQNTAPTDLNHVNCPVFKSDSTTSGYFHAQRCFTVPAVSSGGIGHWQNANSAISFTGLGTVTNKELFARCVGENLEVYGNFTDGTGLSGSTTVSLNLTGYTIKASVLPTKANSQPLGTMWQYNTAGSSYWDSSYVFWIFYDGSTTSKLYFSRNFGSALFMNAAVGNNFYEGTTVAIKFSVPVEECMQ